MRRVSGRRVGRHEVDEGSWGTFLGCVDRLVHFWIGTETVCSLYQYNINKILRSGSVCPYVITEIRERKGSARRQGSFLLRIWSL